jgi:hypothetical protein
MNALTKEAILAADDLGREKVTVKEWGGDVFVRAMTAAERDEWEAGLVSEPDGGAKARLRNLRARLAVLCVVDAAGNRLFGEGDADALGRKSAKALDRIFDVALRLNALGAKDVKELEKN